MITEYYALETADYGTEGWNSIFSSNFQKIDDALYDISTTASGADADLTTHKSADDHTIYPLADGSRLFSTGISGFFDDGTNFRATFSGGILTGLSATVSGGYQIL